MAKEFKLKNGDSELIVSPDGGALVAFNYFGFNYLAEKFNGNFIESGQGQILLPWPNRIKGGVYEYLGTQYQLPINEVAHNNAIHGLLRWDKFYEESITEDSLKLKSFLVAQQGYPFELEVSLSYNLTSSGFKVTTEVINKSLMAVQSRPNLGNHPINANFPGSRPHSDSCYLAVQVRSLISRGHACIHYGLSLGGAVGNIHQDQSPNLAGGYW